MINAEPHELGAVLLEWRGESGGGRRSPSDLPFPVLPAGYQAGPEGFPVAFLLPVPTGRVFLGLIHQQSLFLLLLAKLSNSVVT